VVAARGYTYSIIWSRLGVKRVKYILARRVRSAGQERFFDCALRTVKEYHRKVGYPHSNPVRRGLVKRPEEWKWSSAVEDAGVDGAEQEGRCGLAIDRVTLPADENTRI